MLDGEESNLSVKTQNSFTHCETVGHKVKLLDTLERALRAYESEAFPGISSELFRELVNDVQTLLEEDDQKCQEIASLRAELEDARTTLESASKVIEHLQHSRTKQAQKQQLKPKQHEPEKQAGGHAHDKTESTSSSLTSLPSAQDHSPSSPSCSSSLVMSSQGGPLGVAQQQHASNAELYDNLAKLQEERQQLKGQVTSLQQDLAACSQQAQQDAVRHGSSVQELKAALDEAHQHMQQCRASLGQEAARWQGAAEQAATVAEAVQAQAGQLRAELCSARALVGAHERDSKHCTSLLATTKLELQHACALLDKREERRSEIEACLIRPLVSWYARVGYPQEQQQLLGAQASPELRAASPTTPPQASGKPSAPGHAAAAARAAHMPAASKLPHAKGSAASRSTAAAAAVVAAATSCGGVGAPARAQARGSVPLALPDPVPLAPLPPRSRAFRALADHAGTLLGADVCEVDSAAERRLEVAAAAAQLLMARVGNIQQLKADVLAQLDAAAERYHRMEACLQAKHAAEVARLLEDAQVSARAHARAEAGLRDELGSLQTALAAAAQRATQLQSELDVLRAEAAHRGRAADVAAKDAAAQLRAVAEERQGLQRQLLEAKRGAQEAQADAHAQEVAAAARLRERLALSAQEHALALAQEKERCRALVSEAQDKLAAQLTEAQQAHTRRVSTLQDECAAKLDAAQARLLEAERESSAAQAQLQAKVQALEAGEAHERARAGGLEADLRDHKQAVAVLERERDELVSSLASLRLEAGRLQELAREHQAHMLQHSQEKAEQAQELGHLRPRLAALEGDVRQLEADKLCLARERDELVSSLASLRLEAGRLQELAREHQAHMLQHAHEKAEQARELGHLRPQVAALEGDVRQLEADKLCLARERDDAATALRERVCEYHRRFASLGEAQQALSKQLQQRVQQDEAELRRLQQDLERTASDRSGLATELEALKGMVHRLQAEASAAEQVAERAQQAQQAACAAVEQHRVAADLARQQAAHEQEQHQAQLAQLRAAMLYQQQEAKTKLTELRVRQQELRSTLLHRQTQLFP